MGMARRLAGWGCSTPVVWDHIVVTASVDGQDALLAYDWKGKERWRTTFGKETPVATGMARAVIRQP